jgi:ParB-like chromosome segregation protein Spo0J
MSAIKKIQKEIKWVSVGDIHCHPLNPRKNSKSAKIVAKSIQEYGYINPIVVDEEGTILAGNTRFKALQLLGVEEFDVLVVSGLTDEEKVGFLVADNKVGEYSLWNYAGLQRLVEKSGNKDAMKEIGITTLQDNKDELDKLIAGID